jgi:hypothetical protein
MTQYQTGDRMTRQKLVLPLTYLVIVLFLQAISGWSRTAQAQSASQNLNAPIRITFEPPDEDRPKDSAGGASRNGGKCPQDPKNVEPYVTPLLPVNRYGLTVESHPTFFVYLPPTTAQKAFLSIRDEDERDRYHYQTFVPLMQKSGVMGLKLPADAPPLEIGKTYKWSFVMMCDNRLEPDSPLVEGKIQRIEMNSAMSGQLEGATALERAALYAKAGIWHETLTTLAEIKRSQPENSEIIGIWEDLLRSVELDAITTQPLIR